jgi:hypothetical protein
MEFALKIMLLFLIQLDIVMLIGLDALIHDAQRTIFILLGAPYLGLATTKKCVSTSTVEVERDHQGDGVNSPNSERLSTSKWRTYYF